MMATAPTLQIVTFRLGEDLFAADIFAVERVLRWHQPTSIPNVPDWIEGVIEYQTRVVPVINLRQRFEMEPVEPTNLTRILIFSSGGEWIAATVDAVLEVTVLDAKQLNPPPPLFRGLAGEFLRGVVRRNDKLVIFLDVPRLLSTNERLSLEQATGVTAKNG
jgi:purine-binding chemotaxis protein CheW